MSEFGIGYLQIDDASLADTNRHDQSAIFLTQENVYFKGAAVPTQLTIKIRGSRIGRPYQIPQVPTPKILYHWIWAARSPF